MHAQGFPSIFQVLSSSLRKLRCSAGEDQGWDPREHVCAEKKPDDVGGVLVPAGLSIAAGKCVGPLTRDLSLWGIFGVYDWLSLYSQDVAADRACVIQAKPSPSGMEDPLLARLCLWAAIHGDFQVRDVLYTSWRSVGSGSFGKIDRMR